MAQTMTQTRVQTQSGAQIALNEVKAIKLRDGWHPATDCQVTYLDRSGSPKAVPFTEIEGFSDQQENPSR